MIRLGTHTSQFHPGAARPGQCVVPLQRTDRPFRIALMHRLPQQRLSSRAKRGIRGCFSGLCHRASHRSTLPAKDWQRSPLPVDKADTHGYVCLAIGMEQFERCRCPLEYGPSTPSQPAGWQGDSIHECGSLCAVSGALQPSASYAMRRQ